LALRRAGGDRVVETTAGSECTPYVINCAGLHSDLMARLTGRMPPVRIILFRGEYKGLAGYVKSPAHTDYALRPA
jgi:L-2-hydroxyglutarate oxidase LhgO